MINIELKDIKAMTSPAEFKRGMDYYNRGLVLDWEFEHNQTGILSVVKGTSVYEQEIDFYGSEIEGYCSCPMSYNCKHVAAALIAAYYDKVSNQNVPLTPSLSSESTDWLKTIERSFFSGETNKQPSLKKLLYILTKNDKNAVIPIIKNK